MSAALHSVEELEAHETDAAQPEFQYVVNPKHNIVFVVGMPAAIILGCTSAALGMMFGLGFQMEAWILGGTMWAGFFAVFGVLAWAAHASDNA